MTTIEWTDKTFNPLVGCSKVSEGCRNCYAATAAHSPRLQQFPQYQGITSDRGEWTGEVRFVPEVLQKIRKLRKPQRIFMPSMSDMFHPNVKLEWVEQIWKTIADCPHLTFQILTKRPERINEVLGPKGIGWYAKEGVVPCPQPNVWLGATVENQKAADERIPHLLRSPAVIRFLSCEPLLEKVDIKKWLSPVISTHEGIGYLNGNALTGTEPNSQINWAIIGGESGSGSRHCNTDWIRSLVQQCQSANVLVFVKQLGSLSVATAQIVSFDGVDRPPVGLIPTPGIRDRKGGDIDEWPEDLRIREFPAV